MQLASLCGLSRVLRPIAAWIGVQTYSSQRNTYYIYRLDPIMPKYMRILPTRGRLWHWFSFDEKER
jgi:hypothetical protein